MGGDAGLSYMQQRYMDPVLGVFLSVDPLTAYEQPVLDMTDRIQPPGLITVRNTSVGNLRGKGRGWRAAREYSLLRSASSIQT